MSAHDRGEGRMLAFDSADYPGSPWPKGSRVPGRGGFAIDKSRCRRVPGTAPNQPLKAKEPDMPKTRRLAMDATPVEEAVAQILAHLRENMEGDAAATAEGMLVALIEMCGRADMATDARPRRSPGGLEKRFGPDVSRLRVA